MKNNQAGFTIIEVLVALAMIVSVGSLFSLGLLGYKNLNLKSKTSSTVMKQIHNLVENIRPNLQLYQVNFDPNMDRDVKLKVDSLPMAWNRDYVGKASDCPDCPGRFGYVVQPSTQTGLFILTVRVTHNTWASKYVEYQTFVSIK
ncbi:type IV pilus modification PilV family protein [Bdellovibrio sp. HCB337]|uniref:type IV pilus modification PilV family protein n=1 Tax=Bdellovibrio sp. HCB337 TaxID=3394358 RepID=UPI0039A52229